MENTYDYKAVIAERAAVRKRKRVKRNLTIAIILVIVLTVVAVIFLPGFINKDSLPDVPEKHEDTVITEPEGKDIVESEPEHGQEPVDEPEQGQDEDDEDTRIAAILADPVTYPEALRKKLIFNHEILEFVEGYPESTFDASSAVLTEGDLNEDVPHFLQWDKRWGYAVFADDIMATSGCGPTCLSMVAVALTGDLSATPYAIARYADENGYSESGDGSKWTLMSEGCDRFGLSAEELPLWKAKIDDALTEGRLIIICVGPGDFTDGGHFIVICGIAENGEYVIRDPFSIANTASTWSYETLEPQIRNIWAYEKTPLKVNKGSAES